MILETDGTVFIKCTVKDGEHTVVLPEGITGIGQDAFTGIRPGQIRELYLPQSLFLIHDQGFRELGPLNVLRLYTINVKDAEDGSGRQDEVPEGSDSPHSAIAYVKAKRVEILSGSQGSDVVLQHFRLDDSYIEELYIAAEIEEIRPSIEREFYELERSCFGNVRNLNVVFSEGTGIHHRSNIIANTAMKDTVKTIRMINTRLTVTGWTGRPKRISLPPDGKYGAEGRRILQKYLGDENCSVNWEDLGEIWIGHVRQMKNLEEVILPDGMEQLAGGFSGCGKLKRVVFPASVRKMDHHTLVDCPALESIVIDESADPVIQLEPDAVAECPNLKEIQICHEDPLTGERTVIRSADAREWICSRTIG